MSVYCSFGMFDDDHGDYPQPYGYRRSHVLPTKDDERAGHLDLGSIPAFLTRDGYDDDSDVDGEYWPFLRVGMRGSDAEPDTIVLDAYQVDTLIAELVEWRARVNEDLLKNELPPPEVKS